MSLFNEHEGQGPGGAVPPLWEAPEGNAELGLPRQRRTARGSAPRVMHHGRRGGRRATGSPIPPSYPTWVRAATVQLCFSPQNGAK